MSQPERILTLGDVGPDVRDWLRSAPGELAHAATFAEALELIRQESFAAVVFDPKDHGLQRSINDLLRARRVLDAVPDGLALVGADRRVIWANPTFVQWCEGSAVGRDVYEALGAEPLRDHCPFELALQQSTQPPPAVTARVRGHGGRHLDLHVTPTPGPNGQPNVAVVGRDVSALVQRQQQLDALYNAGRQLVPLAPEQLDEMSIAERIDMLKVNLRQTIRDLLRYQVIEVRLLDRHSGRLEPLLQEGLTPEAAARVLRPAVDGYGVTGHVAATGEGYLCSDSTQDPFFLPGSPGARSSLTVPLVFQDRIIGTLNVESPTPDAFHEEDLRFAEVFGRELRPALHTLELLSAEKASTASQSVEAVSREVALPVDDILHATTAVLERYVGHDSEITGQLKQVLAAAARSIKQAIQKVGEGLAPARPAPVGQPQAPPSLRGMRILVVDSDERLRRSAHLLLGRWGCIVETARDAREALTMTRLGTYDVVLADIRLPDLSGYEAYRQLREAQPKARVILMTGYGYDPGHCLVKARQDGLRHVLFKPFRVDQLLTALAADAPEATPTPTPTPPTPPAGNC